MQQAVQKSALRSTYIRKQKQKSSTKRGIYKVEFEAWAHTRAFMMGTYHSFKDMDRFIPVRRTGLAKTNLLYIF